MVCRIDLPPCCVINGMQTSIFSSPRARRTLALSLALLVIGLIFWTPTLFGQTPAYKVLVFTNVQDDPSDPARERFHADSVAAGITVITQLGAANNFTVDVTDNPADFNAAKLSQYKAVVFLSPEGQTLTDSQKTAFENYITGGGGFVGIHGAMYMARFSWPWYRDLIGASPASGQPPIPANLVTVNVIDRTHPSTKHLPAMWDRRDEWYNFGVVEPEITVLATLDESDYTGGTMNNNHPIAWYRAMGTGRSWYTGGGHYAANWDEPLFRQHVLGGIQWAARMDASPPSPTPTTTPTSPKNKGYLPLVVK